MQYGANMRLRLCGRIRRSRRNWQYSTERGAVRLRIVHGERTKKHQLKVAFSRIVLWNRNKKGEIDKWGIPREFLDYMDTLDFVVGRASVRRLNASNSRSDTSTPRARCVGSTPKVFSSFDTPKQGNYGRPKSPLYRPLHFVHSILHWKGTLAPGGVLFSQSPPRALFSLGLPGKPA